MFLCNRSTFSTLCSSIWKRTVSSMRLGGWAMFRVCSAWVSQLMVSCREVWKPVAKETASSNFAWKVQRFNNKIISLSKSLTNSDNKKRGQDRVIKHSPCVTVLPYGRPSWCWGWPTCSATWPGSAESGWYRVLPPLLHEPEAWTLPDPAGGGTGQLAESAAPEAPAGKEDTNVSWHLG